MYENKIEFPGGMGVQNKKPSVGEYGYFLELHIVQHAHSFLLTRVVASALCTWVLQHLRFWMHLIGQEYLLGTGAVSLL